MTSNIGVIGLGIMGGSMARNLLADGIEVVGYDPAEQAAAAFVNAGGALLASPLEVGRATDLVLVSVASTNALHSVVTGEGGLEGASRPGLGCHRGEHLAAVRQGGGSRGSRHRRCRHD